MDWGLGKAHPGDCTLAPCPSSHWILTPGCPERPPDPGMLKACSLFLGTFQVPAEGGGGGDVATLGARKKILRRG